MAYDKVVDSSVLDAGLLQIANAIREKAGTSDNLAFPDAMAAAIAAIESGVNLDELFNAKVATGSVVLTEDTTSSINVDFGGVFTDIPYFLFAFESIGHSGGTAKRFYGQIIAHQKNADSTATSNCYGYRIIIGDQKKLSTLAYGFTNSVTKNNGIIAFGTTCAGVAGVQYDWIAIGE